MSLQFEDESALEELLNQQLERRRPAQALSRPQTAQVAAASSLSGPTITRPVTSLPTPQPYKPNQEPDDPPPVTGSKGKLASWLDGGPKTSAPSSSTQQKPAGLSEELARAKPALIPASSNNALTMSDFDEDKLQLMSKQRLIQLIREQILPQLESLVSKSSEQSHGEIAKLRGELELERSRVAQAERRFEEEEKSFKIKCNQLLEEHEQQIGKLAKNYQNKLEDERKANEELLKRREEFHQLELDSKLRVNFELSNLNTVFGEWKSIIHSTISAFNDQFKSIESLLDRQTIKVTNTNKDLEAKTKQVVELQDKFDKRGEKMSRIAEKLDELLPKMIESQAQNSRWMDEVGSNLIANLSRRLEELSSKDKQLGELREELAQSKDKLLEETCRLEVEMSKLTYKSEKLTETDTRLIELDKELREKARNLNEREIQLEASRTSLDRTAADLRQLNDELHYSRRKLGAREAKLAKLSELQVTIKRELAQLERLQHSLVCSICLNCLYPAEGQNQLAVGEQSYLANMSKQIELDANRLRRESKFVELLRQSSDLPPGE